MSLVQAFRVDPGAASQDVTAGAAAANSTACPAGRALARIVAVNGNIRFVVGNGAVADATSPILLAGDKEYVLTSPGERVSVIRAGASDVQVNIAFVTR